MQFKFKYIIKNKDLEDRLLPIKLKAQVHQVITLKYSSSKHSQWNKKTQRMF